MKIGLDLDCTISELPEFFSVMTDALLHAGHEVHVITYREAGTEDGVLVELREFGIRFTKLHLPERACHAPEWKALLAAELGLDMMIEDSPEVLSRMPPEVHRFWLCDPDVFNLEVCIEALNRHAVDSGS